MLYGLNLYGLITNIVCYMDSMYVDSISYPFFFRNPMLFVLKVEQVKMGMMKMLG